MKTFEQHTSKLNISNVMERIKKLRQEYDRIRNYEYDDYDDEFNALDRASRIEME